MDRVNILVIPCDTEIAKEIIDSLKYHKYFNLVLAKNKFAKVSEMIEKNVYLLPPEFELNFYEELNKLIGKVNIKFIIPANDNIAFEMSKNASKINSILLTPDYNIHEIVRFKDKTYEFFKDILPVPVIYKYDEVLNGKIDWPVFVKPKKGQGSQNSITITKIKQFRDFFLDKNPEEYIITEYLPFEEYTVDCFAHNGHLLYFSVRERKKVSGGIAVITRLIKDKEIVSYMKIFAEKILSHLNMHGIFFFQVKKDKNGKYKLLEIGPRVPGSLALNRALGINLVELLIYQGMGLINEDSKLYPNNIQSEIILKRSLDRKFIMDLKYENVYIDFDDTLSLDDKTINISVIKFIFHAKNKGKKVFLITKHKKNYLETFLENFGIMKLFDDIILINDNQNKTDFMSSNSILIDDSFQERKEAIERNLLAYSADIVESLIIEE
ncbi:MAG: carbamoylphosphate synthase large subunit short form [Candidatus Woesearchaeota archaeon]|nr:MAG: carbamoylphosphate synthase large subunit short form [Candidatus Woesearchaeota archaeon]